MWLINGHVYQNRIKSYDRKKACEKVADKSEKTTISVRVFCYGKLFYQGADGYEISLGSVERWIRLAMSCKF